MRRTLSTSIPASGTARRPGRTHAGHPAKPARTEHTSRAEKLPRRGQQGMLPFQAREDGGRGDRRRRSAKKTRPGRVNVTHARRPPVDARHPIHVTLRGHRLAPSFRSQLVQLIAWGVFEELSIPPNPDEDKIGSGEIRDPARLFRLARARSARAVRRARDQAIARMGLQRRTDPQRRRHAWLRQPRKTDAIALGFDVVHYSLQDDHVHLLVEATDRRALSCGMRRLVIRLANRINAVLRRSRKGKIWGDRYHRHDLASPSEVRNALVYVLHNGRRHGRVAADELDDFSSARSFACFADLPRDPVNDGLAPRTWLLGIGWRKAGALRTTDTPRLRVSPSRAS